VPPPGGDSAWLFSSSQAIANLLTLEPRADWSGARAVATHPRIAESARSAGFGVVCESRPGLDAVIAALESFR
jgi:uroporphyrinogen-III synthase